MGRKEPDPNCILCRGSGAHTPILVGPVDPVERKKARAEMPDRVECGCTFVWIRPHSLTEADNG